jgi:arylsulfatase A-like enzyme
MLDRRTLLKLAGVLPALRPQSSRSGHPRRPGAQPNFIHICTDDMRFDDLSVMPILRSTMRDRGVRFDNHFTPFPLCAPSRVGMLTGLLPHNHGVLHDKGADGGYEAYRALEANALPVWLSGAGYFVGHIGKFINGYDQVAPDHIPPGYADWRAMSCGFGLYKDFTLNENGDQVFYGDGQYTTDVFVQKALTFLATAPQPFALFFWPNACHWPAVPADRDAGTFAHVKMPQPPSFNEADVSDKPAYIRDLPLIEGHQIEHLINKWRTRAECLQAVDRGLGAIVQALEDNGLAASTHILFTSDNGFMEGEHRIASAKNFLYDEGARVPLYWREPSGYADECRQPASNIDATATIVDLSGAKAGRLLDGLSLSPLLNDVRAPWKTAMLLQSLYTVGIATRDYRYIRWRKTGEVELYDATADPYQLLNVAGRRAYAEIESACAQALETLLECVGANCAWDGKFPPPPVRGT